MKIVELPQVQNGKERREGTEEGKSCRGEESLIPGLLCQGPGVSSKGV